MSSFNYILLFLTFLVVLFTCVPCQASDEIHTQIFDVKPGGNVQEFVQEVEGVKCTFIYAAQGGTKEEWTASTEVEEGGIKLTFTIERPSGMSYLFFQQFRLQVEGAKLVTAQAVGPNGAALNPEEYSVGGQYIEHVEGKFGSQLSAVIISTKKSKREL